MTILSRLSYLSRRNVSRHSLHYLKCQDLQLFFVVHDGKCRFRTVGWTKETRPHFGLWEIVMSHSNICCTYHFTKSETDLLLHRFSLNK